MQGTRSGDSSDGGESSAARRAAQLVVSIVVMTAVTVIVGYGGGVLLTISAALGGPDPKTDDGDLLRERLLAWPQRNREFMRSSGNGEFPWPP